MAIRPSSHSPPQGHGANPIVVMNMARITNRLEGHEARSEVRSKTCMTTVVPLWFLNSDQLLQTGIHPMVGVKVRRETNIVTFI